MRVRRNQRPALPTVTLFFLFALVATGPISAQTNNDLVSNPPNLSPDVEEQISGLVQSYEQLRTLLREQIARNRDLVSQAEIQKAVDDLEAELDEAEARVAILEQMYKTTLDDLKRAEREIVAQKGLIEAIQVDAALEIDTLERVVANTEEERIVLLGPTFSTSGTIGAIGVFNLPSTSVGALGAIDFEPRTRTFRTHVGITVGIFRQRPLVEAWERFRNRISAVERDKPENPDPTLPPTAR